MMRGKMTPAISARTNQSDCQPVERRLHSAGGIGGGQFLSQEFLMETKRAARAMVHIAALRRRAAQVDRQTVFHQGSWMMGRPAELACARLRRVRYAKR